MKADPQEGALSSAFFLVLFALFQEAGCQAICFDEIAKNEFMPTI